MKTKNYTSAPLPFQGQKRLFLRDFKSVLSEVKNPSVFIDLFGGSGLLAHTAKRMFPSARVIYNDYDNYSERIRAIEKTNQIISDLRLILKENGFSISEKKMKIPKELKNIILERLSRESGFVDWITISSNLLFSPQYSKNINELKKETFYNSLRDSNYNADAYLDGLEIKQMDYSELFKKYREVRGAVFFIDPPYLSTDVQTYNNVNYWKMKDYLNIVEILIEVDYIYFTSKKSHIVELFEFFADKFGCVSVFEGAIIKKRNNSVSYNVGYEDIMLYKFSK